ncbi:MAG: type II toxin-antitoxin system prevent-host-death family antitoxin [Rhodomicrobium sp.]
MIRIGASDFQRAFDAISEMAERDPVAITKQGRDRLVVMSAEEYLRLKRRDGQACRAAAPEEVREPAAPAELPSEHTAH